MHAFLCEHLGFADRQVRVLLSSSHQHDCPRSNTFCALPSNQWQHQVLLQYASALVISPSAVEHVHVWCAGWGCHLIWSSCWHRSGPHLARFQLGILQGQLVQGQALLCCTHCLRLCLGMSDGFDPCSTGTAAALSHGCIYWPWRVLSM